MSRKETERAPAGWSRVAHALWLRGEKGPAIQAVLASINAHGGEKKPLPLALQLAYYLYLIGDFRAGAGFLERVRPHYPKHPELLLNLGVLWARAGAHAQAVSCMKEVTAIEPHNAVAFDALAASFYRLHAFDEARQAGTRALVLKDAASRVHSKPGSFPACGPAEWLGRAGRHQVIAFSLWGAHPRYLRGAIDNALAAPTVYPGWTARFYVDETVPSDVRVALAELGAELVMEPPGQPMRQRLTWRFKVANDPAVGRFLVRDVDAVVNPREAWAVTQWIASDRWFHVMRDWWTHTDLMLAGMWGGVAGVLPNLANLLTAYKPKVMETPHIDQIFLRDCVWPLIRSHCLVHDRCFTPPGAQGWDLPEPSDNTHVGQDVFAARCEEQAERLQVWIERHPSLRFEPPAFAHGPAATR